MSSSTNQLVFAILKFLEEQQSQLSVESVESLQVASECLESVFNVSHNDSQYRVPFKLAKIFDDAVKLELASRPPVSAEDKAEAEKHKTEGNACMKDEKYKEALECYGRAIAIDGQNAVYYSNRAAAYSKMNEQQKAIDDCQHALDIDNQYSKAYGRKGLAHTALSEHQLARDCYKKAVELDPANDSYKNNLAMAEKQLSEMGGLGNVAAGNSPFGGMDMSAIFSNPALMNVATSMMGNPQMQQLMAGILPGAGGGGGGGGGASGAPGGMEELLQAGQQLAQQMQQQNPELVEQLRSQMRPPSNQDTNPGDGN